MIDKRIVLYLSLVIVTIFLFSLNIVSAAINITSPADGTNFTRTNVLFNVSYTNITDITDPRNVTFYASPNGNGTLIVVANSTLSGNQTCTANACWMMVNLTLADGNYTINATLFNLTAPATTQIDVLGNANASMNVIFDAESPRVQAANFSSPTTGTNRTGTIIFNVSVIDSTLGVQTVFFNITNSSGAQNATYTASNSAGNQWNFTVNTANFLDGIYNITVYTNDSVNNQNNSALVY